MIVIYLKACECVKCDFQHFEFIIQILDLYIRANQCRAVIVAIYFIACWDFKCRLTSYFVASFFNMVWGKWRQRDDVHRLTSPHFPFAGAKLISFNTEPVVDRRSCEGTWSINNDARDRHVESLLSGTHIIAYSSFVIFVRETYKRKRFGCFLNKINVLKKTLP